MLREIDKGHVKCEQHNGIMTIEFFHPQSNSMPGSLLEARLQPSPDRHG